VRNPEFGIHCHPLDSVNPGFIWRAPPVNPLDSFGCTYMDSEMGQKSSRFRIVCFVGQIAHVGLELGLPVPCSYKVWEIGNPKGSGG